MVSTAKRRRRSWAKRWPGRRRSSKGTGPGSFLCLRRFAGNLRDLDAFHRSLFRRRALLTLGELAQHFRGASVLRERRAGLVTEEHRAVLSSVVFADLDLP